MFSLNLNLNLNILVSAKVLRMQSQLLIVHVLTQERNIGHNSQCQSFMHSNRSDKKKCESQVLSTLDMFEFLGNKLEVIASTLSFLHTNVL